MGYLAWKGQGGQGGQGELALPHDRSAKPFPKGREWGLGGKGRQGRQGEITTNYQLPLFSDN
ncbi:hypothetical protein [Chroococcidiopsis sp. SAG 2025]|uniref:hypothetical protein n=1 Tax=Chroococcidiopsis sp. SAG 2025 TaxID=171389 RepID=UPI002937058F|nr:hypothetical protein [Chroococcidiopsis sp. SAG 2025]